MTAQALPGVQGGIVWALVLFENESPFRVSDAAGETTTYSNIRDLSETIRQQEIDPEFTIEIGAKVRPVLLLQDRSQGRLPEYAALKLTRLDKLDEEDHGAIRRQEVPRFFYIPDPAKYGLKAEFAVDLLALTRVHQSAIVSRPRAQVNVNEFRVICERLVEVLDLDIANRVVREAVEFIKRQGWKPPDLDRLADEAMADADVTVGQRVQIIDAPWLGSFSGKTGVVVALAVGVQGRHCVRFDEPAGMFERGDFHARELIALDPK